jgi:putative nucleotidyltransferase with HDIG domain
MWTINKDKNWESLRKFSWVEDMHGVAQSPVHHKEGDVAIHTQMVLQALENIHEYCGLPAEEREIIWTAALMHDIGKPATTFTDEQGHIVSPGHAKKGAMTARQVLYRELNSPFLVREQIVALVRYHGLPLWIFEKASPVQYLLQTSLCVNTQWLAMLAKADVYGRICKDADELLYRIGLFEELCKEHDCWGNPKQFPSRLARFQYFRRADRTANFLPFDDYTAEATILSGIAGSGKDFYIRKNKPGFPVISLDDMRRTVKATYNNAKANGQIIQQAKEQARVYLRKGQPFVWNATNITQQMREQLIDLFDTYRAKVTIVYVETGYHKLLSQNKNRSYPIPESAIERMIDKLEVPQVWEGHDVEYVIQ